MSSLSSSSTSTSKPPRDVIDVFCFASIFDSATHYLTNSKIKLNPTQQLRFYSLYKQATIGPCNIPQPSLLDFTARSKWNAWNGLGQMTSDTAIAEYVKELDIIAPMWKKENQDGTLEDSGDEDEERGSSDGGGGDMSLGAGQSRPAPIGGEIHVAEEEKQITDWAAENQLDKVRTALSSGVSIDTRDSEGRTALGWAVDRNHIDMVKLLIEKGANVNVQDCDGATPLHTACTCDYYDVVMLLLAAGADTSISDHDEQTAADCTEDTRIQAALKKYR